LKPKESTNRQDLIETALREFREAWYCGQRLDVDEFCRDRTACGTELRARIDNFLFVVLSLDGLTSLINEGEGQ